MIEESKSEVMEAGLEFVSKKRRVKKLEKAVEISKMYFDQHMKPKRIAAALRMTSQQVSVVVQDLKKRLK